MSAHTPGPWKAEHRQGADKQYRTEIFSREYGGIATCEWTKKHCGNGVTETYREANASLIATSPRLLAALEALVKTLAFHDEEGLIEHADEMVEARAAIAQARGTP